jgi:hypothetical protein
MSPPIETLAVLLRRYCEDCLEPHNVPRVSLAEAVRLGDDPLHILPYLAGLGITVRCLEDLMRINDDESEEELQSFRIVEGVAISVASDGAWLVFEP